MTDFEVVNLGFVSSKFGAFGVSPDGLIPSEISGVELKCPVGPTHVKYLLKNELPADNNYKQQVHGSMAVTGARSWYFASYCPNLPMLVIKVEWDEYTDALLAGLKKFDSELTAAYTKIDDIIKEQF